jgi:hypothetical protein
VSGQEPGLRARLSEVLLAWFTRRAIVCEHSQLIVFGDAADAVLAEVQADLDARDARIAELELKLGRATALREAVAEDAENDFETMRDERDEAESRAEQAEAERDRLRAAVERVRALADSWRGTPYNLPGRDVLAALDQAPAEEASET